MFSHVTRLNNTRVYKTVGWGGGELIRQNVKLTTHNHLYSVRNVPVAKANIDEQKQVGERVVYSHKTAL